MNTIKVAQYDTARRLNYTLTIDGAALDLTLATASFLVADGCTVYTNDVVVTGSAQSGSIYYDLQLRDVTNPGIRHCQFKIAYDDGSILMVPTTSSIMLEVFRSVG